MKEILDTKFNFSPRHCTAALHDTLNKPVPSHLLQATRRNGDSTATQRGNVRLAPKGGEVGSARLPPPVSHILEEMGIPRPEERAKSLYHAVGVPATTKGARSLPRRETILQALTDSAYV